MMLEKGEIMVAVVDGRDGVCDVQCNKCGCIYFIIYNRQDMLDWLSGSGYIQDLMPYLSAAERELLISQTCDICFNKMFPSDLDNVE
jgi:hypothetical protein